MIGNRFKFKNSLEYLMGCFFFKSKSVAIKVEKDP